MLNQKRMLIKKASTQACTHTSTTSSHTIKEACIAYINNGRVKERKREAIAYFINQRRSLTMGA